jgi:hypothetical protein
LKIRICNNQAKRGKEGKKHEAAGDDPSKSEKKRLPRPLFYSPEVGLFQEVKSLYSC